MSFVDRKSVRLNLILFSAAVMYSLDLIIECIVLFTQRLSYIQAVYRLFYRYIVNMKNNVDLKRLHYLIHYI